MMNKNRHDALVRRARDVLAWNRAVLYADCNSDAEHVARDASLGGNETAMREALHTVRPKNHARDIALYGELIEGFQRTIYCIKSKRPAMMYACENEIDRMITRGKIRTDVQDMRDIIYYYERKRARAEYRQQQEADNEIMCNGVEHHCLR